MYLTQVQNTQTWTDVHVTRFIQLMIIYTTINELSLSRLQPLLPQVEQFRKLKARNRKSSDAAFWPPAMQQAQILHSADQLSELMSQNL